jgi:hypothetical protein
MIFLCSRYNNDNINNNLFEFSSYNSLYNHAKLKYNNSIQFNSGLRIIIIIIIIITIYYTIMFKVKPFLT